MSIKPDSFKDGESLRDIGCEMVKDGVQVNFQEPDHVTVVLGLFNKAAKTHSAIEILAEQGLLDDANCLLRILLETLANISYILQDPINHTQEYLEFVIIQDRKILQATQRNAGIRGVINEENRKWITSNFKDIKTRISEDEYARRMGSRSWHGEEIESFLRSLGLQSFYDLTYRDASRAVHATDFYNHISYESRKGFTLLGCSNSLTPKMIIGISNLIFALVLQRVNDSLELGQEKSIQKYLDRFVDQHKLETEVKS